MMTNTEIMTAAQDIAYAMPHRMPNFFATMHAMINDRFPTIDDADRMRLCDAIIDLKF